MQNSEQWDWTAGKKVVSDLGQWPSAFEAVAESCVSPDGEKIAAIVKNDDGDFSVCVNSAPWETRFDKIWRLRFRPDGRTVVFVSEDSLWTVAIDGVPWESRFEFVWDMHFGGCGSPVSVAAQNDRSYFVVSDDISWESGYHSLNNLTTGPDGRTVAAVVQTVPLRQADISGFQKGCFTVAVNGTAWESNFVNAWQIDICTDGHAAVEARQTLYDYTIAVDGIAWRQSFASVWRPRFHPIDQTVTAPVRVSDCWTLARDGAVIWNGRYNQLWHHRYSPDGNRIAAICAPKFGRWTITEEDIPWRLTFNESVTDLVFSPDSRHIACVGKSDGRYFMVVDGKAWQQSYDRLWPPVFSPDGEHVAVKAEIGDRFAIVIDGRPIEPSFKRAWDPVFSPDGRKILVKGIVSDAEYCRYVLETGALNRNC